jgi:hypothetical protein
MQLNRNRIIFRFLAQFREQEHHNRIMSTATLPVRRSSSERATSGIHLNKQSQPTTKRRTTVTLSARAAEIVEEFQTAAGISASEAISALIERTEETPARIKIVDGIPMADLPLTGKWVTHEDIIRAQAELG